MSTCPRSGSAPLMLIVIVILMMLSGCATEQSKKEEPKPSTTVSAREADPVELLVYYKNGAAEEIGPSHEQFGRLANGAKKFIEFSYGPVRWADGGNYEVVRSVQYDEGLLVVFSKTTALQNVDANPDYPCKRLYIPLSGTFSDNPKAIVMPSGSMYSWDWGGLYIDEVGAQEIANLKSIIASFE